MPKTTEFKPTLIKAIFTNLLFVLGVILMVIGFVQGTATLAKTVLFDTYPLQSYEESRCDIPTYPVMAGTPLDGSGSDQKMMDTQKPEAQREKCLQEVEQTRKVKQIEDIVGSISFLIAGGLLTLSFKRFIFGE